MKKLILAALVLVGLTCQAQKNEEKETVVVIKTSMGTIKAKLYNDTPLHRDNLRPTISTRKVPFALPAKATK